MTKMRRPSAKRSWLSLSLTIIIRIRVMISPLAATRTRSSPHRLDRIGVMTFFTDNRRESEGKGESRRREMMK